MDSTEVKRTDERPSSLPQNIVLLRHIVGVAIVLLAQNPKLYEGVPHFIGRWLGTIAIAFGGAGLITGLVYLFFTSRLKGKVRRTFVTCAWVIAGLQLFGQWVLPDLMKRISNPALKAGFVENIPKTVERTLDGGANRVKFPKQLEYYDLNLGMTKNDVISKKGSPYVVYGEPAADGSQIIIPPNKIDKGKSIKDFNSWGYDLSENQRVDLHRLEIRFDKNFGRIVEIGCYDAEGIGRCLAILGIATGSSMEDVINRFGKPDIQETVGGFGPSKALKMAYENLNLSIHLEHRKVYMIKVAGNF